jgi:hypothetical protein
VIQPLASFSSPLPGLVIAGLIVLLLPGMLLILLWPRSQVFDLAEHVAYGAAFSWCVVTALCVIAFTLEWAIDTVVWVIIGIDVALAVACVVRRERPAWLRFDAWHIALILAIAAVALVSYRIGGYTDPRTGPTVGPGWSTMEESLQISTVRKIAGAPRLRVDEVMYAKGEIPTYFYPVFPFALAVMSRIGHLDPLVFFDGFRLWTAALGLLAFYALARGILGTAAGTIAALTAIVLVLTGQAGQAAGMGSWGQLIPLSHIGDFGLGVLLPLALGGIARVVENEPAGDGFTIGTLLFVIAVALTHTREAVHVASYAAALLVAGPILGAVTRRTWIRLACVTTALLLFVSMYSVLIQTKVPFIREHEAASAARARVDTEATRAAGIAAIKSADVPPLLRPYVTVAFLLAPLALVRFRRSPGVVMIAGGLLLWWIPLHVPIAARLLERIVYSEVMMTPSRYVFHVGYLFFGAAVYVGLRAVDDAVARLDGARPISRIALSFMGAAGVAAAMVLVPRWLDRALGAKPVLLAALAIAVAAIGAFARGSVASVDSPRAALRFRHRWWVMATAGAAVALAILMGTTVNLFALAASRQWRPARDLEAWYAQAAIRETLPWSTVNLLRTGIPPRSIVAADPALGLAIPLVADQFVLVSGTNFTTDLHYLEAVQRVTGSEFSPQGVDWSAYRARLGGELSAQARTDVVVWEKYYQRLAHLVAIGTRADPRHSPIFNEHEQSEVTFGLLDVLDPDYILVLSAQHVRLSRLIAQHRDRFERVGKDDRFELYRIRLPSHQ